MKSIETNTIGDAWVESIKTVLDLGKTVHDGDTKLKEFINLAIKINHPEKEDDILKKYADEKMIEFMISNFLEKEPVLNWGYSYGQRIYDFSGINQFKKIANKLKKNPESKSATISLMNPPEDQKHVPCITVLDFKIRDGHLLATAFFRSQDIGKKFYADAICIGKIGKMISEKINNVPVKLLFVISSAHIYEPDIEKVKKIVGDQDGLVKS